MDLDTLITTVYVFVDDWYKANMRYQVARRTGPPVKLSDSEVLTIALVGQWRVGVPWRSERGVVRYMQTHGRGWFPSMLGGSAYNARVRNLWRVFLELQQALARELAAPTDSYEVVDCVPVPACSLAQAEKGTGHWCWWGNKARGGTRSGWFWGDQALLSVRPGGAITGWVLASAHTDDRWLLQALISYRAGAPNIVGPPPMQADRTAEPPTHLGPTCALQGQAQQTYLADKGFNGERWLNHWLSQFQCRVITAPSVNEIGRKWPRRLRRWLNSKRQIVETCFAILADVFDFQSLGAHSLWGLYTRLSITMAAFNLGIWLNRLAGRSDLALETLIN